MKVSHEVFAAIQCDLAFALNALGEKEESRAILEKIRTNSLPKYPSSVSRELVVVSATIGKEKGCDLELKFRKRRDKGLVFLAVKHRVVYSFFTVG